MIADDGIMKIWFCRPGRVLRYSQGIDAFLSRLAGDYMLDRVAIAPGDWIADCGANLSEAPAYLGKRCEDLHFNAFGVATVHERIIVGT